MARYGTPATDASASFELLAFRRAQSPADAATGTIAGTLSDAATGEGQRGWTVFLDANNNGRHDLGEQSTRSDAAGHYEFADVAPGTYRVVAQASFGWQRWSFGEAAAPIAHAADLTPIERLKAAVAASQIEPAAPMAADFGLAHVEGQLIVKLADGAMPLAQTQALMASVGATLVGSTVALGAQLWQIDGVSIEDAAARLLASGQVAYADPNYIARVAGAPSVTPDDPRYVQQYGPEQIDAPEAWAYGTGSDTVIVADIDSGMDMTHPDLAGNLWTNAGEIAGNGVDDDGNGFVDDVHGWDFVNGDNDPTDDYFHGTHVAGTIGAVGDNGVGVAGMAWDVAIMPLKFIDANNFGTSFDAARAVEYATMMGAEVTSNSYGVGPATVLRDAIAAGGLFVAAAGNNSSDNDKRGFFPASFELDNIISVAAVDAYRELADFSNYGRRSVDLAAPGVNVMSTMPVWDGSYGYASGTSMATPHVAGAVALLMSLAPDLSLAEIKAALLNGVTPLASLQGKVLTGGELSVMGALDAIASASQKVTVTAGETAIADFAAHGLATRSGDALHGYDLGERITGLRGDDAIAGGAGDDVLVGGAGNDRLTGGRGADVFVFTGASGADTILDFDAGDGDTILIRAPGGADFDDLAITSNGQGGAIVAFEASRIELVGVRPGALGPDDFVFVSRAGPLFAPDPGFSTLPLA
jgi:subtilisin family serine protease